MFNDKIIFITWWTWTWWQAIVKDLLKNYNVKKIIIFSRSEDKQVNMEKEFNNDKLLFILWDVRNKELLQKVTIWVDYIIHLAALKHISKCRENPEEAVSINIDGTKNIIDVAIINNIKKALYISTDKAVDPYNLYWNTKSISEKLFINANKDIRNPKTTFFILRAWNILWSNGSVLKIFYNQLISYRPITVTDLDMRRFYISMYEVINLIYFAFNYTKWGEIFIPKCEVLSLEDLLSIFLEIYWKWNEKIVKLWIKKWEKINEILISSNEVTNTYTINDGKAFLIDNLWNNPSNLEKVKFNEYSTLTEYNKSNLDVDKIKKDIIKLFS